MRYFLYCRKSTESEDRQVLSIGSQESELRRAFEGQNSIHIVDVLRESYSAKAPGRPIFNEMMERITRGEADGILAWHPDRLARNSIDGGRIIYLLDTRQLKDLKFAGFNFENTPQGILMLQVLLGFSKYYVDALSENIKRGNRAKIALGWRPNMAPIGYLNDKNTRTIIPDPERFSLVRRIFDVALTGTYSLRSIRDASEQWGLRTRAHKRIGGVYLSISAIYRILTNPFYAGMLVWNGQISAGSQQSVVTMEEFDRIQRLLRRPGKPAPQKHSFPLTGMIRCGDCGRMVTAERKVKGNGKTYCYYHCTKRRLDYRCRQPSVSAASLDAMLQEVLARITIPERLRPFFVTELHRLQAERTEETTTAQSDLRRAIDHAARSLENVTMLRIRELISDEEFLRQRQALQQELLRLREQERLARNPDSWFEPVQLLVSFGGRAADWYRTGDDHVKRLIVSAVCSNSMLRDKILSVEARKPFVWTADEPSCSNLRRALNDVRTREDVPARQEALRIIEELRELHVRQDSEYLAVVDLVRKVVDAVEGKGDAPSVIPKESSHQPPRRSVRFLREVVLKGGATGRSPG